MKNYARPGRREIGFRRVSALFHSLCRFFVCSVNLVFFLFQFVFFARIVGLLRAAVSAASLIRTRQVNVGSRAWLGGRRGGAAGAPEPCARPLRRFHLLVVHCGPPSPLPLCYFFASLGSFLVVVMVTGHIDSDYPISHSARELN